MAAEKILIVDDDEDVLLIVQTILDNAGYSASSARNGREGVEKAIESKPDLILLDVMMPELSGWEVCTTLKSAPETRQIPIAMLTVKSEIRDLITGHAGRRRRLHHQALHAQEAPLDGAPAPRREARRRRPSFLTTENEEVRFKNLLFDAVTELPTVPVIIDALRDRLLDNRDMGVLYIDVEQYSHIEETYGWEVFDALLRHTAQDAAADARDGLRDGGLRRRQPRGRLGLLRLRHARGRARTRSPRLQRKARQVEESLRGIARRGVRLPDPQAHRRLRRARAAPPEPADARRAARLPRAAAGDRDRDDEGGGAPGAPARDLQGHPAQAPHPDRLPADLPPRDAWSSSATRR